MGSYSPEAVSQRGFNRCLEDFSFHHAGAYRWFVAELRACFSGCSALGAWMRTGWCVRWCISSKRAEISDSSVESARQETPGSQPGRTGTSGRVGSSCRPFGPPVTARTGGLRRHAVFGIQKGRAALPGFRRTPPWRSCVCPSPGLAFHTSGARRCSRASCLPAPLLAGALPP